MRPPKVLVVYYNDTDYSLIEMMLQDRLNPLQLQRATDGAEAIEILRNASSSLQDSRPDLIILELNLPRVNGFEVLQFIQSQEYIRDIPVVIFASEYSASAKSMASNLGAVDLLPKPISIDQMVRLLDGICSKYLGYRGLST